MRISCDWRTRDCFNQFKAIKKHLTTWFNPIQLLDTSFIIFRFFPHISSFNYFQLLPPPPKKKKHKNAETQQNTFFIPTKKLQLSKSASPSCLNNSWTSVNFSRFSVGPRWHLLCWVGCPSPDASGKLWRFSLGSWWWLECWDKGPTQGKWWIKYIPLHSQSN